MIFATAAEAPDVPVDVAAKSLASGAQEHHAAGDLAYRAACCPAFPTTLG
jgi:hypothetical protein